jgi:glycosyltransferase involved in cell wall biosynthesis
MSPAADALVTLRTRLSSFVEGLRRGVEYNRPRDTRRLVILDDVFPSRLSAFRIAEYTSYLLTWQDAVVYSKGDASMLSPEHEGFTETVRSYEAMFPEAKGRVHAYRPRTRYRASLAYTVFLNNAHAFLGGLERNRTPFAFTLYPGGGFKPGVAECDAKLKRVLESPLFRKVIVTQKLSLDYLTERDLTTPEKIAYIYGYVPPSDRLEAGSHRKALYPTDKETLDICFVAYRYTPHGEDKGFDVFVTVGRRMLERHPELRLHVVGNFCSDDVPGAALGPRCIFYGPLASEDLARHFASMDIMLAPNAAFVRAGGEFDGFPTGSAVEAALCGVAVFATDPLNLNTALEDGRDLVILRRDPEAILRTTEEYLSDPVRLYALARRGRDSFMRVFDPQAQLRARRQVLEECMSGGGALRTPPGQAAT